MKYIRDLLYYDCPIIIEAEDNGKCILGVTYGFAKKGESYLLAAITQSVLQDFINCKLSVVEAFLNRIDDCKLGYIDDCNIIITNNCVTNPEDYLPTENMYVRAKNARFINKI